MKKTPSFYSLSFYLGYLIFVKINIFSGSILKIVIIYILLLLAIISGIVLRNKVHYKAINMIALVLSILTIIGFTWGFIDAYLGIAN